MGDVFPCVQKNVDVFLSALRSFAWGLLCDVSYGRLRYLVVKILSCQHLFKHNTKACAQTSFLPRRALDLSVIRLLFCTLFCDFLEWESTPNWLRPLFLLPSDNGTLHEWRSASLLTYFMVVLVTAMFSVESWPSPPRSFRLVPSEDFEY